MLVTFSTPSGRAARPPSRRSIQSASSRPWRACTPKARPGQAAHHVSFGEASSPSLACSGRTTAAQNGHSCCTTGMMLSCDPVQADAVSAGPKGTHNSPLTRRDPLRGVKPLQGSLLTLHIPSPLRPSDWQLAGTRALNSTLWMAAIVHLELLGRRTMLCSVMKNEKLALLICSPPPANMAEIRSEAVGPDW